MPTTDEHSGLPVSRFDLVQLCNKCADQVAASG